MWLTFPTDTTTMATYYPILILVWSYVMNLYSTAPGLSLVRLQCETIVVQSVHQSSTPVVHTHFQSKIHVQTPHKTISGKSLFAQCHTVVLYVGHISDTSTQAGWSCDTTNYVQSPM